MSLVEAGFPEMRRPGCGEARWWAPEAEVPLVQAIGHRGWMEADDRTNGRDAGRGGQDMARGRTGAQEGRRPG